MSRTIHLPRGTAALAATSIDLVLKFLLVVSAGTALGLVSARMAGAHDAPRGWSYPFQCCSGYDCRAVRSTAISERADGYVIAGTGELLPYSDARLRHSPDGEFHWCSVQGKDDSRTICLFVPPRSF